MTAACVFCGADGPLTREHTLPAWLGRIGLPSDPVKHATGRLNRNPKDRGVSAPFTRVVRVVCATCNNGWLSDLDAAAKTALTQPILGRATTIEPALCGLVAAWFQKVCLVNMLSTPDGKMVRSTQLGDEMRAMYARRDRSSPLDATTVWIGRSVAKERLATVCLTPMVVGVEGIRSSDLPSAYAMTLTIGELLLHGVRFTSPLLEFDLEVQHGLAGLWPADAPIGWPAGVPVDDARRVIMEMGRFLRPTDSRFTIERWKPATDLPDQELDGDWIRSAAPCGEHFVRFPLPLALAGRDGMPTAFLVSCECSRYFVVTHRTGIRFKCGAPLDRPDGTDAVSREYANVESVEQFLEGPLGIFPFKELPLTFEA
jgi:hypothetical protein